jgi:hypothetical protein
MADDNLAMRPVRVTRVFAPVETLLIEWIGEKVFALETGGSPRPF